MGFDYQPFTRRGIKKMELRTGVVVGGGRVVVCGGKEFSLAEEVRVLPKTHKADTLMSMSQ